MRDRDGPRNGGHRSAESLRLLQKRIEAVRRIVRFRGAWERARWHRRLLSARGSRPRQCIGGERRAEKRNELPSLHECRPTPKDNTLTHRARRSRRIIKTSRPVGVIVVPFSELRAGPTPQKRTLLTR